MLLRGIHIIIIYEYLKVVNSNLYWNLYGKPGDGYYMTVDIGNPPQRFNLLVDTGSSNLAVAGSTYPGLETFYEPNNSTTYINNGTFVKVSYSQGWWTGVIGSDYVQILSMANIPSVMSDLSIITGTHGFYVNNSHWQGILGLAYPEIAKPEGIVRSWFDTINEKYPELVGNNFSLQLCGPQPFPNRSIHIGKLSIGDFNHSCSKSEYSTPIHHRWYYEVIVTGLNVGDYSIDIPCPDFNSPKTIVDSGTSNLKLSFKSYYYVISALISQTEKKLHSFPQLFWDGKMEICFPPNQEPWSSFPTLTIFLNHDNDSHFGIQIPPNSYLRPSLNTSNATMECWLLGIEKSHFGTVLGAVVLEGLCVSFDREAGFISFSQSSCGPSVVLLPKRIKNDYSSCNFTLYVFNGASIAALVILLLVLIPLGIAFVRWLWITHIKERVNIGNPPFLSLDESNPTSA